MVNVEEGELAPLLADDDKDGVPKVPDLRIRMHQEVRMISNEQS